MLIFNKAYAKPSYTGMFGYFLALCLLAMGLGIKDASATPSPGCSGCVLLFDGWNRAVVGNNPIDYPVFTTTQSWNITRIQDYHWNDGQGQDPAPVNGNISLYDNSTGDLIGKWSVTSFPFWTPINTVWEASPNVILNPGTYKIVDSDPATWSYSTDYFGPTPIYPNDAPNWKPGVGFSAVYAAVPLPAAVWLFGSALAGLIGFGRRKRFGDWLNIV